VVRAPKAAYRGRISGTLSRLGFALTIAALIASIHGTIVALSDVLWRDWVPHYTQPSWMAIGVFLAAVVFVVSIVERRDMAIGAGLMVGGALANTLDASRDGVVQDYLPLPGTPVWANAADLGLVAGGCVMVLACARWLAARRRERAYA
jgi:lipoprotein signal peptidase